MSESADEQFVIYRHIFSFSEKKEKEICFVDHVEKFIGEENKKLDHKRNAQDATTEMQ